MFDYCTGLTSLDVSSWDINKVTDYSYMFDGCKSLTTLRVKQGTYDWWYSRLKAAKIQNQVTIIEV
jgi:surface protein